MKSLSRKMLISVLAFALTFIGLGASTFAWFTLATTNTVENLSITVSAGAGLEIALGDPDVANINELEWLAELSGAKVAAKIGGNLDLESVTSSDGKTFKTGANGATIGNIDVDTTNEIFVKVPVYFRATHVESVTVGQRGVGVYVYNYNSSATYDNASTQEGSFIVSRGSGELTADVPFKDLNGTDRVAGDTIGPYYAAEAARISFIPVTYALISIDDDEASTAYGTAKIFDFSGTPSYGYAYKSGDTSYNVNGFVSYYQSKTSTTLTLPTSQPTTTLASALTTFAADTGYAVNENSFIVTMTETSAGSEIYVGKCYMCVWLEGWDADCFDAIFKDQMIIQMAFKLAYGSTVISEP